MGDVTVHDGPEPLDGIEMRAIGRQLDQMNATVFARQERSDIGAFVVWSIVPKGVPTDRVQPVDCETVPVLMLQEHRRPVQDGKTYETAGHDKAIAIVEHPIPNPQQQTSKQGQKRITWAARFSGINRGQDRLNFRPVQNRLSVVKRMKRTMVKLARGDKKFRLGGERFLHAKS